jgi:succinate-semialdehyde dehydrogenase/glutarate-semialdehyde dehydrogenase
MAIESINPATEERLATFDEHTSDQVDAILADGAAAFPAWRERSFDQRGQLMMRMAAVLRDRNADLARLITLEMGKPITQSEAEIEKCAWACDHYAEHAAQLLADQPVETNARESLVAYEPLGTILAVMPWNFPFWQVFRFAAPALMGGNVAVLKHASNVPQCALAIEELFDQAGFPRGVFRTLLVSGSAVDGIIADARVVAVTLTGSDATGSKVAAAAGRHLKKTVLELGGSDPFIVLEDADLDAAAQIGAKARYQNTGQSCIAAKRFIVANAVADAFERRFVDAVSALRTGDPMERDTDVGPLARADLRDQLHRQVGESVVMGARVVLGGGPLARRGYFYEPTVVADVVDGLPVWQEETFGPVAALVRLKDVQEMLAAANDSPFGLGANLWTADVETGTRLARQIQSGFVAINGMVASDPRLPFGGVKRSGYGRELGEFGIREFMNVQTIWVGPARAAATAVSAAADERDRRHRQDGRDGRVPKVAAPTKPAAVLHKPGVPPVPAE